MDDGFPDGAMVAGPRDVTPGTHDDARVAALRGALEDVFGCLERAEWGSALLRAHKAIRADEARGATPDPAYECDGPNWQRPWGHDNGPTPDPGAREKAAEWLERLTSAIHLGTVGVPPNRSCLPGSDDKWEGYLLGVEESIAAVQAAIRDLLGGGA